MDTPSPHTVSLHDIVTLLDTRLRISEIRDAPVALNGLQVENDGRVTKVAMAVDGTQKTIQDAIEAGADLLLLHHGIYWCGLKPMTGWWREKIRFCLEHNLAIYAAHLPLDLHPELGNNAGLARGLGLSDIRPELDYHGMQIGLSGTFAGTVGELKERFGTLTGSQVTGHIENAAAPAGRVVVCSGAAGEEIYQVQAKGYSCYLTGEENHWVHNAAQDMGINMMFAGHYATETFGVKSLGALLAQEFGLPTVFIDNPTHM